MAHGFRRHIEMELCPNAEARGHDVIVSLMRDVSASKTNEDVEESESHKRREAEKAVERVENAVGEHKAAVWVVVTCHCMV